jgi:site-specific DNA recombinase
VATPEERREMVILLLKPGGLFYDMEQKMIAAIKPRPAFLPILRMLCGVVEYDEAKGLLVTERWQDRNRRDSNPRSSA